MFIATNYTFFLQFFVDDNKTHSFSVLAYILGLYTESASLPMQSVSSDVRLSVCLWSDMEFGTNITRTRFVNKILPNKNAYVMTNLL